MIVLDASAAAELFLDTVSGGRVNAMVRGERLHAPAHFDVEVASTIRRAVARDLLSDRDGLMCLSELQVFPVRRWAVTPFIDRAYALRHTHSVGDAVYVALAESLDAPLVTTDARLARSHGHHAHIEDVS